MHVSAAEERLKGSCRSGKYVTLHAETAGSAAA